MPTPASAASTELHSQHAVPDVPPSDTKTEEQEYDIGIKTEPKMEVCFAYVFNTDNIKKFILNRKSAY